MAIRVTIDLTDQEANLVRTYCLLRGVQGAIDNPAEYECEAIDAVQTFERIRTKIVQAIFAQAIYGQGSK